MRFLRCLIACLSVVLASFSARADPPPAVYCADVTIILGTPAMAKFTEYVIDQVRQVREAMPLTGVNPSPAPDPSYTGFIRRVITACSETPSLRVQDVVSLEYVNAVFAGQPYVGG